MGDYMRVLVCMCVGGRGDVLASQGIPFLGPAPRSDFPLGGLALALMIG